MSSACVRSSTTTAGRTGPSSRTTAAIALHDRADLARIVPDLKPGDGDRALVVLHVDDVDAYIAEIGGRGAGPITEPVVLDGRIRAAYLRAPRETSWSCSNGHSTREQLAPRA
jgi:lactoylglutathione lyase